MAVDTPPRGSQGAVGLEWLWRAAVLAVAYFVVAKLGLRYATIGPSISPVWPPTGLAIAALVILGLRYWPAVLVGAFLANATTPVPIIAAFGIGCGNATEAVLAAYLLRRRCGSQLMLDDLGSVRTLVGIAARSGLLQARLLASRLLGSLRCYRTVVSFQRSAFGGAVITSRAGCCPVVLTWRGRPPVPGRFAAKPSSCCRMSSGRCWQQQSFSAT
jgi:integral membrane sensor domain MASE1